VPLITLFLLASVARGQTQTCQLIESWVHFKPFQASSNELVGKFPLVTVDRPITKVFRHEETGLDVSVGVEVMKGSSDDAPPTAIRVALVVGSKTNQVFDSTEASEAMAVYDKHWRYLSVSRNVTRNDRLYTFTLFCERLPRKRR